MDLHDYKDVAENYDRYLEVMYQTSHNYDGFIEFYTELAKQYGSGGIIDIACGTGAVVLDNSKARFFSMFKIFNILIAFSI